MTNQNTLLLIHGKDASVFLLGQISQKLPSSEQCNYGLLLNSNGRIISDLFLYGYDSEHFLLEIYPSRVDAVVNALMEKIALEQVTISQTDTLFSSTTNDKNIAAKADWAVIDPRTAEMGYRLISQSTSSVDTDYHARRLSLGLPEASDMPVGIALPLEYGLEHTAIAFDKGCFIGQEVCTRMHRRNIGKYTVIPVQYSDLTEVDTPNQNDHITHDSKNIGTVISIHPQYNIAFVRILRSHVNSVWDQPPNPKNHPLWLAKTQQPWRKQPA